MQTTAGRLCAVRSIDWKTPKSVLYAVDTKNGFLTPMAEIGYPLSHGLVAC